jgi:hypothetical protein
MRLGQQRLADMVCTFVNAVQPTPTMNTRSPMVSVRKKRKDWAQL